MNTFWIKFCTIVAMVLGEGFFIYAEMLGAHQVGSLSWETVVKMFILVILSGGLLIFAYMWGFRSFENIWIIVVISLASILVIEPTLAWAFFHQLPTTGALIGFILGVLGAIISVLF